MKTQKDRAWAVEKIKKCLALFAKGSGNEAAIALRQAQALMRKYGISDCDVKMSEIREAFVDVGRGSKNPPQWKSSLAGLCAGAFNCRILLFTQYDRNHKLIIEKIKRIRFIGIDTNAELAGYTYEVLVRQLQRDRKQYVKSLHPNCSLTTRRRRADLFADNWVKAVIKLVNDFAKNHQSLNLIDAYIAKKYSNTTPVEYAKKTKDKRYDSARIAGQKAGKNAQLNHAIYQHKEEQLVLSLEGVR